MRLKLLFFVYFLNVISFGYGANILFLSPLASPSHHNWNRNLYLAMAKNGHNVTALSPDTDQDITENLHYIKLDGVYEGIYNASDETVDLIDFAKSSEWEAFEFFWHWGKVNNHLAAKSQGFQTLLNYPDTFKFDLIVMDYTMSGFLIGFLHKFRYPPVVAVTPFSVPHYFTTTFGGHRQPSYIPHHGSRFSDRMTFYERVINYIYYLVDDYHYQFSFIPDQNELLHEMFKYKNLPHITELQKHLGLALVNVHPAVEQYHPLPSNMIPVGGLQIQDPKPLNPEIKSFIEAGKQGTVLFSLGTNVKSEMLDDDMKKMFISVFAELPQYNFLWKYESDLKISLPKNVMIQAWLKQNDILAHKNLKAFISHCGLMSTQEATWRGVPVVGMPFFADQRRNIIGLVNRGTGIELDVFTLKRDEFKAALLEILENPKYYENAQRRAHVFQDQKEKPLERAVFWLEWAMRHKNDFHIIQSPVQIIGDFIGNGYDVMLFGLAIVTVFTLMIFKCYQKFCNKKSQQKEKLN
uniref:CSON000515 protein n=1 Tax=Culicoides sonorensis TaxID=179676 RepID=A0A336MEL0_CULSO